MNRLNLAAAFGRHDFVIRRAHSLLGLVPLGGYLVFHLFTNAAIFDGAKTYQHRSDQIHVLGPSTIFLLEWTLIFLPLLFHAAIGTMIVTRGKRNVWNYSFFDNWRYTLQRLSGVVALVFVFWHVFEMHGWVRWPWWIANIIEPLGGARFDPLAAPLTAAATIQRSPWIIALYAVGVIASVYHLANGLVSMGMTWGVWTSERARRRMLWPAAVVCAGLSVVGLAALWAMATLDLDDPALQAREARQPPAFTEGIFEDLLPQPAPAPRSER
jgi:succinate dehydrogenase / fumarate reductase cytochrome b subunit